MASWSQGWFYRPWQLPLTETEVTGEIATIQLLYGFEDGGQGLFVSLTDSSGATPAELGIYLDGDNNLFFPELSAGGDMTNGVVAFVVPGNSGRPAASLRVKIWTPSYEYDNFWTRRVGTTEAP